MAIPIIRIDQAGKPVKSAGESRSDLDDSADITAVDTTNLTGPWNWILESPCGSTATLVSSGTNPVSFTPDIPAGTWLLYAARGGELSYTVDAIGQRISTQGGASLRLSNGNRIPGVGETVQFGPDGWACAMTDKFKNDIIVKDQGSALSGGIPFNKLDFVGKGVFVEDVGSGEAIITVSGITDVPLTTSLGSWEYLDTITVTGSAVQLVSFGSAGDGDTQRTLEGNSDEIYVLVHKIKNANGPSTGTFTLRPNGLTSNLSSQRFTSSGTIGVNTNYSSDLVLSEFDSDQAHGVTEIYAATGFERRTTTRVSSGPPGTSVALHNYAGAWNDSSTPITSLGIYSTSGTHIDVGSEFILYRIKKINAGSGALVHLQHIKTIDVPINTDTVTFSDLDGDVDETYVIEYHWTAVTVSGGGEQLAIRPNNITSNQGYRYITLDDTTEVTGERLIIAGAADEEYGTAVLQAKTGRNRILHSEGTFLSSQVVSSSSVHMRKTASAWGDTTTNITSLVIASQTSSDVDEVEIKAGSVFKLYKLTTLGTGSAAVQVQQGGITVNTVSCLDFVGNAIQATASGTCVRINVDTNGAESNHWYYPATPHSEDFEFDADPLPNGWSENFTRSASEVDSYAGFASGDPRVNISSARSSWYMVQPPGNASDYFLHKPITLPTNAFFMARLVNSHRDTGISNNDGTIGIIISATSGGVPDRTDSIELYPYETDSNTMNGQFHSIQGGVLVPSTPRTTADRDDGRGQFYEYAAIQKIGNTYHGWLLSDAGQKFYLDSITYTGGATLDRIGFIFINAQTTTPGNSIMQIDFFRMEEGIKII